MELHANGRLLRRWGAGELPDTGTVREVCAAALRDGAPKVVWLAEVCDEASWQVAHAVGFGYEGHRRAELGPADARVDAWAGSLLPDELGDTHPLPWLEDPVLTDGDVVVRRYRADDLDTWLAMRNEADVVRRGHGGPSRRALTRDEAWHQLFVRGVERRMTGQGLDLAITAAGVLCGDVSIHREGGGAVLGWWVGAAHRGRGLAGTAAALVADLLRASGTVDRLEARVHVANIGSQRAAERAGLRREGLCVRDSPWDGDEMEDGYLYGCAVP